MQTIINSQLPEFSVQAFQNGQFKTVTDKDVKGKWGIFFSLSGRLHFCLSDRIGRYG